MSYSDIIRLDPETGNILESLWHLLWHFPSFPAVTTFSNTLQKFKCPVSSPVNSRWFIEKMQRNLWSSMQKCKPFSHWPEMPTVQCVQWRVHLYSTCWSCQLRMVPDPVKTWTTQLPTHSKCCLRHRPSHWCRCKIVVKMWGNLSIVIIASENTLQKSYCGVIQFCNYKVFAPCDHKLWGEHKTMTCSC